MVRVALAALAVLPSPGLADPGPDTSEDDGWFADEQRPTAIPYPSEPPAPRILAPVGEEVPAPAALPTPADVGAVPALMAGEDPAAGVEEWRLPRTLPVLPAHSGPVYPVVVNDTVEALIDYFSARERERFRLWIARSGRYLGMIQRVLRERGLPEELAYTAMIESGFSPRAVSRVGAKGMWQFMEATGRRYGLAVTRWVDERLDPVKSTVAAARYLGDLHGMFGHWFLAQAAYNAGETRVARAIQRARTSDFWALTQTRHLPDETKLFVPQILAATQITRDPARYGFEEIALQSPLAFDEVTVRRPLDFETIAELAGVTVDEVHDLNPALLGRITPPLGSYLLRLPVGAGSRFDAAVRDAAPGRLVTWALHRVGKSQTLADIARLYRVTPERLAKVNHLPGGRLRGVTDLLVPVSNRSEPATTGERAAAPRPAARPAPRLAAREVTVQRGDTLSSIAARHGVKPDTLARLNGMQLEDTLPAGTRLRVAGP